MERSSTRSFELPPFLFWVSPPQDALRHALDKIGSEHFSQGVCYFTSCHSGQEHKHPVDLILVSKRSSYVRPKRYVVPGTAMKSYLARQWNRTWYDSERRLIRPNVLSCFWSFFLSRPRVSPRSSRQASFVSWWEKHHWSITGDHG